MSIDLIKEYEYAYWKIRYVLEDAIWMLPSPHPMWGNLNELIEVLDEMEERLNIPNGSELGLRSKVHENTD